MNILVARLDNIGDILTTLGMSVKIKEKYPTANVVYLVRKANVILPQMYGYVDNVVAYEDNDDVCGALKGYEFDYVIDLRSSRETLTMLESLNAPIIRRAKISKIKCILEFLPFVVSCESYKHVKIVTLKKAKLAKAICCALPFFFRRLKNNKLLYILRTKDLHESQIAELFLFPLGITELNDLDTNSRNIANNFKPIGDIPTNHKRYFLQKDRFNLVVHPGSNGHGEEWPLEKYIELIQALDKDKYNIFITGSEKEWLSHGSIIHASCPHAINLTNQFSLQEFMVFISKADVLIASGTGPLHLAAAVGAHAIGLFPTRSGINSKRWKPLGDKVTVFEEKNMSEIKVTDIINSLEQKSQ